jgi:tetratricopeptide (TPR) repeat protein
VNRSQLILTVSGLLLVIVLFFFGNTIPPKKDPPPMMAAATAKPTLQFKDLLMKAKQRLTPEQSDRVTRIENSVTRGDVKEQQINAYKQLASFWKDSIHLFEPYAFYNGEAAKLESSEKNLTFAAQQFLERLLVEGDPAMQNWLATNAKVLLEQALQINPANDSSKIGLGACYILGGISDNPMQGILPVREIAQKDPNNLYAQYILALGGKKSGQFDKAIERFLIISKAEPDNIEIDLHLAECYDLKSDKQNAIKWYSKVKEKVKNRNALKELTDRINILKQ